MASNVTTVVSGGYSVRGETTRRENSKEDHSGLGWKGHTLLFLSFIWLELSHMTTKTGKEAAKFSQGLSGPVSRKGGDGFVTR